MYIPTQNEIKQLYSQLVKKKTALQQSLNEISGQSIDEQLQVIIQNSSEWPDLRQRVLGISCLSKARPLASVGEVEVIILMRTINVGLQMHGFLKHNVLKQ